MSNVERVGRGPYDAAIIEGFAQHLSAEEVSQRAPINGTLSPEECLSRLNKIIQNRDILDAVTLSKLNMEDAYYLRNRLRKQMESEDHITKDSATTFLKAIDGVQTRIERSTQGYEDQMIRMQEIHARVMAQAIQTAYQTVALRLQQEFGIAPEIAYGMLQEALVVSEGALKAEISG